MNDRQPRVPIATYRLQFGPTLTFGDARAIIDYLAALGISDVYASPVFRARSGSRHGYDVVDHGALSPELGGEGAFAALADALRERDMGLVLDLVPNHMCVATPENRWWADVLENGPSSPFADYFDIDWSPPKVELHEKVLLPFLGDQFGKVLEAGLIRLVFEAGGFLAVYGDHRFAVAPKSQVAILEPALDRLRQALGEGDAHVAELSSILTSLHHLPSRSEREAARVEERRREKEVIKRRLAALWGEVAEMRDVLEAVVGEFNGRPGDAQSFDRLERLLLEQGYRLSYWQVAADEINYRRFFDVNELAAVRAEVPHVFADLHALPFRLLDEGRATGFRIDHVDGLVDPKEYLQRFPGGAYVIVEKILTGEERLPPDWPAHGTTGYEYLNALNAAFVDPRGVSALRHAYEDLTGCRESLAEAAYECKKLVLAVSLSSELIVLARHLDRLSEQHRHSRDFTLHSLQAALTEVVACFPVYRTYVRPDGTISAEDRRHMRTALADARRRNRGLSGSLFDFLGSVLLLDHPAGLDDEARASRVDFVLRFQQLTAPAMAKGLEDTAFYRVRPLASLCEVGSAVHFPRDPVAAFHRLNEWRLAQSPHALSATSTHDTKQDEDVRARLDVLSEMPEEWELAVRRLIALNDRHRTALDDGTAAPTRRDEYLLYQAALGVWPRVSETADHTGLIGRLTEHAIKAAREAKVDTSWVSPNAAYEQAVRSFIEKAFVDSPENESLSSLVALVSVVDRAGMLTAVSQTLLKIASPGVPDFYQGTEWPAYRLVDPDNRQAVDFAARERWLREVEAEGTRDPVELADRALKALDGRLKMFVIRQALAFRASHIGLLRSGRYLPLAARGDRGENVLAFARCADQAGIVVAAARFFTQLPDPPVGGAVWRATYLPLQGAEVTSVYRDALTRRVVPIELGPHGPGLPLEAVFRHLPFALLEREA